MKQVPSSEIDNICKLFSGSLYQNEHLGWLNLHELAQSKNGQLVYEDTSSEKVLLAFQYTVSDAIWLHSMLCNKKPDKFDLGQVFKFSGFSHRNSLYTISSHRWYTHFLQRNAFVKCDEIVQFESNQIIIPDNTASCEFHQINNSDKESLLENCESAFPPLWRLGINELSNAIDNANIKIMVKKNNNCIGYLLAVISEDNCHLLRIAVKNSHQNMGIASSLIREMIQESLNRDIHNFSVNTNIKNIPAITFYKKLNLSIQSPGYPVYYRYI